MRSSFVNPTSNNDSFWVLLVSGFRRASFRKPRGHPHRRGKMADARISMYMPPDINPTQAAIAYGCRALPKLNEELQSEDLVTRQKALMALCGLMHDPEHVYMAIHIGEWVIAQVSNSIWGGAI